MKRVNSKTKRLVRHRTTCKKKPRNSSRKIKGGTLGATLGSIFGAAGSFAIFTLIQSSGTAVGEVVQGTANAANTASQVVEGTVNAVVSSHGNMNNAIHIGSTAAQTATYTSSNQTKTKKNTPQ